MKSWPLEKIPNLDFRAITAIVQSITQSEFSRRSPLGFVSRTPDEFSLLRWQYIGLDHDNLQSVTHQCNTMFHVNVPVPKTDETCGEMSRCILSQWGCGPRPVTFFTSGSTGEPKPCTHMESHLRQEITSVAPLVEDRTSALVTVPMHHMYGFTFGLLLPLSLDIPIRSVPPLPTLVAAQMMPGDAVVGIPLLWSQLVAMRNWQVEASEVGGDITIFTATSPTPSEVLNAMLSNSFSVIEFFGSSEVGVVCCRMNPEIPFELLPHVDRGKGEDENVLIRHLPDGEIKQYPLQDNITWVSERHLKPGSRIDKAVQVGGTNVYPQYVASRLEEVEGVKHCIVRLMRPKEGQRLKAFVVPEFNWDVNKLHESLVRFARQELTDAQRPTRFSFGKDIPRGLVGKPADW